MSKAVTAGIALIALHFLCAEAMAQQSSTQPQPGQQNQPGGRQPNRTPKPGYVVPPENSAGFYPVNGEPIFKARCASCHEPAVDRAPPRQQLATRSPEEVFDAMTLGVMKPMTEGLTDAEIYGVVRYLTGKSPVPQTASAPDPNPCKTNPPLQANGPQWNGWGNGVENLRYQPNPGFTAKEIPRLKVRWAFSYPGTKNSQPLIFGDRVFVGSMSGKVYSLDTKTGCVHWRFDYRGGARASMTIGPLAAAPSKYALYVGDDRMVVHALDAGSGKELWKVQVHNHKVGRITGTPTLHNNVLYVPLSSAEESQGRVATYECCTFIGTVVAISALDGHTLWKQAVIDATPKPTRKNPAGTQMYGPAGAAIWAAPTIDAKRGQLYVSTGNNYTEVEHPGANAIVAMDLKTGKIKWTNQVLAKDNFVTGQINAPLGKMGPDFDFGSSPQLITVDGRDLVVTGSKAAIVYAMDPDTGKTIWETPKLNPGSPAGGVEWSTATDGKIVYAPLADNPTRGKPGLVALDAKSGKTLWRTDSPDQPCNVPSGRCLPGLSQAATAVPGALFAGAADGRLRAYSAMDGKVIWEYDTTTPIDTVNGVKQAPGGGLDMGGPTIAGGAMFVHSGYSGSAGANNLLLAFSVDGK